MGAKKTGVTQVENGKELYVSLAKIEEPQEGERTSREKLGLETFLEEDQKVTLTNNERNKLFETIVEAGGNAEGQFLRIVIANAIVGHGYYLTTSNLKGEYKKTVYLETKK